MNKRVVLTLLLSGIAITSICTLLILGNDTSAPNLDLAALTPPSVNATFIADASDPNYTVLCIKKNDVKQEYTNTGPYVTCPPDYFNVPMKLDPARIEK